MIITTPKGKYIVEKNDSINIAKFNGLKKNSETMNVAINGKTLNVMLENTKKKIGDKFFTYKAVDNNCQFFISSILESNGLMTNELQNFILQDTRKLFENNPKFRKFVNSITDIGAIGNNLKQKAEEISQQPLTQSVQNELLTPIYRGLTLQNQLLKGFSNPFRR